MIRKIISYLPLIGLLSLVATLPFPFGPMQRIALYMSAIGYLLDYVINQRWQSFQWTKEKWVYVAFIAFFSLTPIRQLFDSQLTPYYKFEIEHYMPFLIFGVVGILGMNGRLKVRYFAYVMLLVCFGIFGYVLYQVGFTTFFESANRILIFNTIRREINSHMVINLYCNTALICGCYTLFQRNITRTERILTALSCCLVFLFTMLSEGRIGVATTCLLLVIMVVYSCWKYNKKLLIPLLIISVAISGYFISHHERMSKMHAFEDPRMAIWDYSWDMIKQKPIFGYGASSYSIEYVENAIKDERLQSYLSFILTVPLFQGQKLSVMMMHPHNSLLKAWLEFGILGVILLALCLSLPVFLFPPRKRFFLGLFLMVFTFQSMFEIIGIHVPITLLTLMVLVYHYSIDFPIAQPLEKA